MNFAKGMQHGSGVVAYISCITHYWEGAIFFAIMAVYWQREAANVKLVVK